MIHSPVTASLIRFLLILIGFTLVFGIIGLLAPMLASLLSYGVLLPYFIAFVMMSNFFVAKNQALPSLRQRWQLSIGAMLLFWVYSAVAGSIGFVLSQDVDDALALLFTPLYQSALTLWMLLLMLLSIILVGLGFWFLGKPLAMIHHVHQP